MKKIINGKMYNTETACLMGERSNCYGPSDFRCCSEQLYQKRTKEFFMYGSGGAMTRYAEYVEGCGSTYSSELGSGNMLDSTFNLDKRFPGDVHVFQLQHSDKISLSITFF